jgi:hypothetical protein
MAPIPQIDGRNLFPLQAGPPAGLYISRLPPSAPLVTDVSRAAGNKGHRPPGPGFHVQSDHAESRGAADPAATLSATPMLTVAGTPASRQPSSRRRASNSARTFGGYEPTGHACISTRSHAQGRRYPPTPGAHVTAGIRASTTGVPVTPRVRRGLGCAGASAAASASGAACGRQLGLLARAHVSGPQRSWRDAPDRGRGVHYGAGRALAVVYRSRAPLATTAAGFASWLGSSRGSWW